MSGQRKKMLGSFVHDDGVHFGVWAPNAEFVSVNVRNDFTTEETILSSDGKGYWFGVSKNAVAGQSYKFHIQGPDDAWFDRNDPRARQLTNSEDGESLIIDHTYDWEGVEQPLIPQNQQILYELHVGTFNKPDAATGGTFLTAIEKLDYLQNLGINVIELMPVTSMAFSKGWGYNPTHLFAVESSYGGRHGLLDFVKECHKRGIAVILDIIYNHIYNDTDLWRFDGWSENGRGGIYFYNDERGDTPWSASRLDYGRSEVRDLILDNVTMWLNEYKLDGLRLDSTHSMRNTKGYNNDPAHDLADAWSLLQEITTLAKKINPHSLMVAEDASTNEFITKPVDQGGAGFDAQWDTGFPLAIRKTFGMDNLNYGESLSFVIGRQYNGNSFQRVIYGDSHDTAANGWVRLNEATTPGNAGSVFARQRSLIANALALTSPGIPMILQGEEFLQKGSFNDWQMLEWEKTTQFAGIVLAHQHLINLRKNIYHNTAGLTGSSVNIFFEDSKNNVIAYHRFESGGPGDDVIVIINCSDIRYPEYQLKLPLSGTWHVRFNSSWKGYSPDFNETALGSVTTDKDGQAIVALADYNVLILGQD